MSNWVETLIVWVFGGLALAIGIAGVIGYCWNIVKIMPLQGFSGELLIRVAGIFLPPLGGVLGWL